MERNVPSPLSSKVPAWFERKFDFAFPVEQYPIVCVRLRGTPARLEEMLRNVMAKQEVLVAKRQEKWSVKSTQATWSISSLCGWRAWMISSLAETHSPPRIRVIARPMKPAIIPGHWPGF